MSHQNKRFTRPITTAEGVTLTVKIEADNNTVITLTEDGVYGATLDAQSAHNLGQALIYAARLAALNIVMKPSSEIANVA